MAVPHATFTIAQLSGYFDHIGLPRRYHSILDPTRASSGSATKPDLDLLTALHVHQIAAIPYENLSLHYSAAKTISLDPQDLYRKFVTIGRNRGGYCMEGSLFFYHVLRSLGFDVYPTGVRIRLREDGIPSGDYIGFVHIILIVTFADGSRYATDVSFGGDGPTQPLPLIPDVATTNLGAQEVRYVFEPIPQVSRRALGEQQRFWTYQYRNGPDRDWISFYCFTDTEFLEADFGIINYYTSQGRTFQRVTVLAIKFLRSGGDADAVEDVERRAITGKLMMLQGTLKRNLGGKTEIVKECKTEEERVQALKEWFGIELTEEEVAGIKGEVTELRDAEVVVA